MDLDSTTVIPTPKPEEVNIREYIETSQSNNTEYTNKHG
jgi:hypothetical protein